MLAVVIKMKFQIVLCVEADIKL